MALGRISVRVGKKGRAKAHNDYILKQGYYAKDKAELVASDYGNMPSWAKDNPALFWQMSDELERKNGSVYREHILSLPREFGIVSQENKNLLNDWIKQEMGEKFVYQYAIHNKKAMDGLEQTHVHLMYCERILDGIDRPPEQFFKRYNAKNPEKGGCKKDRTGDNYTERRAHLIAQRTRWGDMLNKHLLENGIKKTVDMRNYKKRGVPKPHNFTFSELKNPDLRRLMFDKAKHKFFTERYTSKIDFKGEIAKLKNEKQAQLDLQKVEADRLEAERLATLELQRIEAEKQAEIERLKILKQEQEAEAQRIEAQRLQEEADRLELEQQEAERLAQQALEQEWQELAKAKPEYKTAKNLFMLRVNLIPDIIKDHVFKKDSSIGQLIMPIDTAYRHMQQHNYMTWGVYKVKVKHLEIGNRKILDEDDLNTDHQPDTAKLQALALESMREHNDQFFTDYAKLPYVLLCEKYPQITPYDMKQAAESGRIFNLRQNYRLQDPSPATIARQLDLVRQIAPNTPIPAPTELPVTPQSPPTPTQSPQEPSRSRFRM